MKDNDLLELIKEFKKNSSDAVRNRIIEELYADIFDIAKDQSPKLPEKYEISDLFNAAIIALLENIETVSTKNTEEMNHEIFNIVENAIQQELMLAIGSPKQTFIDHDEALELKKKNFKVN